MLSKIVWSVMLRGVVCGAQRGKQLAQLLAAMVALATHCCLTAPDPDHGRHSPAWQTI